MSKKSKLKDMNLWIFILIIIIGIIIGYAVAVRILQLHILIEFFYIHHWFSWIGAVYIAIDVPVIYWLKQRYPDKRQRLIGMHIFGNLIATLLISIHFTQQLTRPQEFYPDLGTGLVLIIILLLLIGTGFIMRFVKPPSLYRNLRYFHAGITFSFYIVIIIHILHGLEII